MKLYLFNGIMYDVPKFTCTERLTVKNIVALLTIKRIPDSEIIKSIFDQLGSIPYGISINPEDDFNDKKASNKGIAPKANGLTIIPANNSPKTTGSLTGKTTTVSCCSDTSSIEPFFNSNSLGLPFSLF
ncbi:MAG: hypothetical protein WBY28_08415 [Nitrososphaeraceae archaeon]